MLASRTAPGSPACLYPFVGVKAWISIPVPGMTYTEATLQLMGAVGKAKPCQGRDGARCSDTWDVSSASHICSLTAIVTIRRDLVRQCPQLAGPLCALSPRRRCVSRKEGLKTPAGCVLCSPSTSGLLQEFFVDKPGLTGWAGFPQPALGHQLQYFIEVFWKPEDTVLSPTLVGHHHSLPKPSPRSTCGKSPRLPRLLECKPHWANDQCWKRSLAMGLLRGRGTSAHI